MNEKLYMNKLHILCPVVSEIKPKAIFVSTQKKKITCVIVELFLCHNLMIMTCFYFNLQKNIWHTIKLSPHSRLQKKQKTCFFNFVLEFVLLVGNILCNSNTLLKYYYLEGKDQQSVASDMNLAV